MGAGIASTLVSKGHHVVWAPEGRSAETATRAAAAGMEAVASIDEMAGRCEIIVSACPPHAALEVAKKVASAATGFGGTYLDANAISPTTAEAVSLVIGAAGARYLDGGVIGNPPAQGQSTRLYLSGPGASDVAEQLSTPLLDVVVLDGLLTAASTLKMAYAAWSKGAAALILAIRATAEYYGVDEHLLGEWARSNPVLTGQSDRAAVSAMTKGWRWTGEMEEIAATFRGADIPDGFGLAAPKCSDACHAKSHAVAPRTCARFSMTSLVEYGSCRDAEFGATQPQGRWGRNRCAGPHARG
jgi:3-hydroxyisobutyrate dehydrogenase-like beta-hydroxyacid dehydrogenase